MGILDGGADSKGGRLVVFRYRLSVSAASTSWYEGINVD